MLNIEMSDQERTIASDKDTTHRYGPNTFKLLGLPVPRAGQVLGIVGKNGIGKSTAIRLLSGRLKPNLGRFDASIKPQHISCIKKAHEDSGNPKVIQGKIGNKVVMLHRNVGQLLTQGDERDMKQEVAADLELTRVMDRDVGDLSGGELQKFAIAIAALRNADIYLFDEPSSILMLDKD